MLVTIIEPSEGNSWHYYIMMNFFWAPSFEISTNRIEAVLPTEELWWTSSSKKQHIGPVEAGMLSGASPLLDNKEVFIRWIHLHVCDFPAQPWSSASLLLSFAWMRRRCCHHGRCRLSQPSGPVWYILFFWNLLWFFKPLLNLSFVSTSGKIVGFIENYLTAHLPGVGHWPLWLPWFHTTGAFLGFVCLHLIRWPL